MDDASYAAWRDRLAEALDEDLYPASYLDWIIANHQAAFFGNEQAALVIEIKTYPSGLRAVHFLVGAGDLSEMIEVLRPAIEAWGCANGCAKSLVESRKGWARALNKHGYEMFQVSLMKAL